MEEKEKLGKELKKVRKDKLEKNKDFSNKAYEKRISEHEDNIVAYDRIKNLRWHDVFIVLGIFSVFLFISSLTSFIKDKIWFEKFTAAILLGLVLLSVLVTIIIGAARNREAIKMYNDKTRRYSPTFTNFEAFVKKIQKVIILSDVLVIISLIIIYFVCKN